MNFLEKVLPFKHQEIEDLLAEHRKTPPARPTTMPIREFRQALCGGSRIIAEIKYRSPSKSGQLLRTSPANQARCYRRAGAAAISIVTDEQNFGTSLADVSAVRRASGLPVLVKDFYFHPVQIKAAWAAGADAVLLIVRMLDAVGLTEMLAEARSLGLTALVECHDKRDIKIALSAGAEIIGINNRDLVTLTTALQKTSQLMALLPDSVTVVSESGLSCRQDISRLATEGVDAFLIGHALLQHVDPRRKIRELLGQESETQTRIKICGITTPADARFCHSQGADILGIIFADSPRTITIDQGVQIRKGVPEAVICGVFCDTTLDQIATAARLCELDMIQLHGQEDNLYCAQVSHQTGLPVIKSCQLDVTGSFTQKANKQADYLLLDLPKTQSGSGSEQDCSTEHLTGTTSFIQDCSQGVFIAGNLTADNVGPLVKDLQPFVVDVCSGVEQKPGIKDHQLVRQFIAAASDQPASSTTDWPAGDGPGRFGGFGGMFVPETLMPCLLELEQTYNSFKEEPKLKAELQELLSDYSGRPTSLYRSRNLEHEFGNTALVYLKREDLNHTGAHKINNCLGQVLLTKRMGKSRVVAETGAGQHGVATATVCARAGLACTIYMGAKDMERQAPNVHRMRLLGADVRCVTTGCQTLKDATSEAIRDWVTNVADTHYIIGSTVGPHPYPTIVRDFQAVIGDETRTQILQKEKRLPDAVVACVGGGSNAIGIFNAFLADQSVRLFGVEAGGSADGNSAALCLGQPGVLHGSYSYLLQDNHGQVIPAHSIAAGLDYPGVGPQHSQLKDTGRVAYYSVTDKEATAAFFDLTRLEGIIPALESSHAIAFCRQLLADRNNKYKFQINDEQLADDRHKPIVVINLSGRGDKDLSSMEETDG